MKKESIYKIIKYVTAFFSIIMIICFIIQLARVYFGDLSPMYSRDIVGKYLLQILPIIILWIISIICGFVYSLIVKEKKHIYVKTTNEAMLKILEANFKDDISRNEEYKALEKCHKKMKIALIISLVIYAICLIMISLYLFNPAHFLYDGNINGQMLDLLINTSPWLIISLITIIVYTYYVDYESKNGVVYAKAIIKNEGRSKIIKFKKIRNEKLIINIIRTCIIVIAIVFIIVGVVAGGPQRVYQKAINICTECIGLG